MNEVENEIHCLIACPNQTQFREHLYDIAKQLINNFELLNKSDKFVALMTSQEPEILNCLGKISYEYRRIKSQTHPSPEAK